MAFDRKRMDAKVQRYLQSHQGRKVLDEFVLYVNGSTLRNARADWVIDAARHKALQAADAAVSKHAKSRSDSRILKGLAPASAERPHSESRIQIKNTSLQSIPPRARESGPNGGLTDEKAPATASAELVSLNRRRGWVQ